jgi:hypothetical protein
LPRKLIGARVGRRGGTMKGKTSRQNDHFQMPIPDQALTGISDS